MRIPLALAEEYDLPLILRIRMAEADARAVEEANEANAGALFGI